MFTKLLYVIARDLSFFSLPIFRVLRNRIYAVHLKAPSINVDKGVRIQSLHSHPESSCRIGRELHVGSYCLIDLSGSMQIGDRVTLSEGAKVFTHSHPIDNGPQDWRKNKLIFSNLEIGDDVWIGANAIILSSVRKIGRGAVIAAGSIVSRDVGANVVVAGIPAKYIRDRRLNE